MGMQYNPSAFDPSQLGRIISSTPVYGDISNSGSNPEGGANGPQLSGYAVVRESPWGPILVNAQDAQGTPKSGATGEPQYTTARPNADGSIGDFNNQVGFMDRGDGQFVEFDGAQYQTEMSRKNGYDQFKKFLITAGLGVGAAYAAGAGAAGGTAAAGSGSGAATGTVGATGAGTSAAELAAMDTAMASGGYSGAATGTAAAGGAAPAAGAATGWQAVADAAAKAGTTVADYVSKNPGIVASLVGAAAGYLGNKDDQTATQTSKTEMDPQALAQRNSVFNKINQYAAETPAKYGAGNTPGGVNWGGTSPAQAPSGQRPGGVFAASQPQGANSMMTKQAGVQGGTAADFAPGGRFSMTPGPIVNTPGFNATKPFNPYGGTNSSMAAPGSNTPAPVRGGPIVNTPGFNATKPFDVFGGPNSSIAPIGSAVSGMPAQGGVFKNGPSAGGMPDWGGSNAYMPQVNQYLQQGTAGLNATANPLASENNPYLTGMIDSAGRDLRTNYDNMVAPKFASGSSFGSSGLGFAEVLARDDQAKQLANISTNLRFQDHNLRSDLLEKGATRQDELNSGQRSNALDAGRTWGTLGANAGQFNANFDFGAFTNQQDEQYRRTQALLQSAGLPANQTASNSVTTRGNPWAGAAGGAIAGANMWSQWNTQNQKQTKTQNPFENRWST